MTKNRQIVFDKYGGRCAYTGKPLDDKWQIDHKLCRLETTCTMTDRDNIENMLPTLRIINHYKRGLFFNEWRERISKLHIRLQALPKNPKVQKSIKTKVYLLEVADAFGITPEKPFNGIFYFETLKQEL